MADASASNPFFVPKEVCRDFPQSSRLEWLDTNHTGAFAMGTVAGVNTRRYHTLLIASCDPPADRISLLPRVEETIEFLGRQFEIGTAQFPGTVQPRGFEMLEEFRIDPFPTWRFTIDELTLEKTLCLIDRRQAVLVRYTSTNTCTLRVRLFLSYRDYHSLVHQNQNLSTTCQFESGRCSFQPYADLPELTIFNSSDTFIPDAKWFLNNEYLRDLERGLDFREDLYSPGFLLLDLQPDRPAWFLATIEPEQFQSVDSAAIETILTSEANRRSFRDPLARALDQFRIVRADGVPSLIAGYPWFTDWGRDTLISLPALIQAGFPPAETKQIISMLLAQRREGIIPNRFADLRGTPEYNTADATLWLFIAAHELMQQIDDRDFLSHVLYPAAIDILDWHHRGTLFNVAADPDDNLLHAGAPGQQLTWMDAKVGDHVITPRVGKPVEISALWYNAQRIASEWAALLNLPDDAKKYSLQADMTRASFNRKFWNEHAGCLYDVVTDSANDASIRPNQLSAIALLFPLLDRQRAQSVVNVVRDKLLTPVGLRTLAPGDPAYRPRFEGDMASRDSAYHQGTVWPWLIGPYVSAYLYAFGHDPSSLDYCDGILRRLENEIGACCLGSISELYDAEEPQRPGGCPAQLWSVAQLIIARTLVLRSRSTE